MHSHISRRNLLRLAGAGVGGAYLASLTGCGGNGGAGGGGKVSFWHYYGTPDTPVGRPLQDLFDRYMKEHPDVEIENRYVPFPEFNRTLLQSAAGQKLPDIALVNGFDTGTLAEAGVLADLTDRVDDWGQQDAYIPSIWETTAWKGKTYGVPHVADCYVLWFNESMLDKVSAQPPKTWDELGSLATKLGANGDQHGLAVCAGEGVEGATAWMIRFLAAGGEFPQIDSAAGRSALEQWKSLIGEGAMSRGVLGWSEEDVYNRFRTEQAAMMINSATYVNLLRDEAPELKWSVALLPQDEKRATFLSEENLAITSGAKNPDAAWDLVTYMQRSPVMRKYLPERNKLPTRDDIAEGPPWSKDDVWSVFVEQLPSAWAPEAKIAAKSAEILTHVQRAIQAAVSGDSSVADALSDAQQKIDRAVES